jgi:hypothetical protein
MAGSHLNFTEAVGLRLHEAPDEHDNAAVKASYISGKKSRGDQGHGRKD